MAGEKPGDRCFDPCVELLGARRAKPERHPELLVADHPAEQLLGRDLQVVDFDLAGVNLGSEEGPEVPVGTGRAMLEERPAQLREPDVTDERLMPGDGPPLHRHPWATWEVVVEGTLLVRMGDEDLTVGPGDLVYTPPGLVHTFVVTGDAPARLIGMNWPGGFHRLYGELAEAFRGEGPPDFGAMAAAAARYDAEILGPPLSVTGGA